MAAATIEERLSALEAEVARLKNQAESAMQPWWTEIRGTFKDDPIYVEAMRLGREWRDSQPIPSLEDEQS